MNSKALHKALFCMLTILFISLPSMAQNNEKAIYGTYPGTMSTKITKEGSVYDGVVKKVSFVISPEESGSISILMKGYTIYGRELQDVLLPKNVITKTAGGWQISEGSFVQGDYKTKDNEYDITLTFKIHGGMINQDGTCTLSLSVQFTNSTIRHEFKGSKVVTGIKNVNAVQNVSKDIYDLQGRRVEKPGHGIYIVGGKKVMF